MTKLSTKETFNLGQAHMSFTDGQYDQAIHMILPSGSPDGYTENEVFHPLFDNYLEQLSRSDEAYPEAVWMGAIQAFCKDNGIDIGFDDDVHIYNDAVRRVS